MIRFYPDRCTACHACAVACMDENDIDVTAGERAYCLVERQERNGRSVYISHICRHCAGAPCIRACPTGCLRKDAASGLTVYDSAACVGCGACGAVCPWDAVSFAGQPPRMAKCRGCGEQLAAGRLPACARACPAGALVFEV